jgi:hypothetical protein
MKIKALILTLFLAAIAPLGLANKVAGAYTLMASDETAQNTIDNQPLQIVFDIPSGNATNVINIYTNSNCAGYDSSFPSGAITLNSDGSLKSIKFTTTGGSTFTYTWSSGENWGDTGDGTFASSGGGCAQADAGKFTTQITPALSGLYTGTLDSNTGTNNDPPGYTGVQASVNFVTNPDFTLAGTVVKIWGVDSNGNALCSGAPAQFNLTVNSAADHVGGFTSLQAGNVWMFNATDSNGNTIGFIGNPTGEDGNTNAPGAIFLTYEGEAGVCTGAYGPDAPFKPVKKVHTHGRIPLRLNRKAQ